MRVGLSHRRTAVVLSCLIAELDERSIILIVARSPSVSDRAGRRLRSLLAELSPTRCTFVVSAVAVRSGRMFRVHSWPSSAGGSCEWEGSSTHPDGRGAKNSSKPWPSAGTGFRSPSGSCPIGRGYPMISCRGERRRHVRHFRSGTSAWPTVVRRCGWELAGDEVCSARPCHSPRRSSRNNMPWRTACSRVGVCRMMPRWWRRRLYIPTSSPMMKTMLGCFAYPRRLLNGGFRTLFARP